MTTRASGVAATIRRVASSPSIPRHLDVHQHDVGRPPADLLDRRGAIGRLAHALDVRLGLEQEPEPRADHRLVVGEDDADHALAPVVRRYGKSCVDAEAAVIRRAGVHGPAVHAARSRMPTSPSPDPRPAPRSPATCPGPLTTTRRRSVPSIETVTVTGTGPA